jgi:type IV pilus assembly protein PilC
MKTKIESGSRFAETLQEYPGCFDELYVSLVVAGEEGGMLDTILMRLANYIEKTEKLRKKVKTALIYPSSIVVVAIGVVLILLLFVIPVFEKMSRLGKALPLPTQIAYPEQHREIVHPLYRRDRDRHGLCPAKVL